LISRKGDGCQYQLNVNLQASHGFGVQSACLCSGAFCLLRGKFDFSRIIRDESESKRRRACGQIESNAIGFALFSLQDAHSLAALSIFVSAQNDSPFMAQEEA
jgi:hypothetical protein